MKPIKEVAAMIKNIITKENVLVNAGSEFFNSRLERLSAIHIPIITPINPKTMA